MLSIVGIVALLAGLLLVRFLIRLWNRRTAAWLEQHLRGAHDLASRTRAEREAGDCQPGEARRALADGPPLRVEP